MAEIKYQLFFINKQDIMASLWSVLKSKVTGYENIFSNISIIDN